MENLKDYIPEIYNFPNEGIVFKDINPIYNQPKLWNQITLPIQELITTIKPDYIAGVEARGFITASALAFKNQIGLITIRKPNKLPGKVIGVNYQLEYGEDRLEIQQDLITKQSKILIIDDLLATGGTASAAGELIIKAGGNLIGYGFLVELTKLEGRKRLENNLYIKSSVKY
ncbi:adenine phosphoribosyltransferase [Prochlorococcus marinus]|uniref:Adenine phosphoribosyltransferase n=1 Tax=Prochlorococcus marinus XMU1408 TaxID=2213228 RepID=A0A318R5W0_PROMR|nr:adenine phosphoribosyltransferase [Prochlorococcus marinus]MBW3042005.1 adenine phosphoribosyltransferase [Prochlorococcus marinus str. XMU1408]PYE03128.1 adenine phosphoribosyltransferase [Prochlorococcus marinus XMU1408]